MKTATKAKTANPKRSCGHYALDSRCEKCQERMVDAILCPEHSRSNKGLRPVKDILQEMVDRMERQL